MNNIRSLTQWPAWTVWGDRKLVADSDELAALGQRVMLRFPTGWTPGDPIPTYIAPKDQLSSGWVMGFVSESHKIIFLSNENDNSK